MILYLIQYLSDLCASYSYVLAKEFYTTAFYSTTEMFAYCNIYILAIILALHPILKGKYNINLLKIRHYIKNKAIIHATLLSVFAAYIKTLLLGNILNISQITLRSYSIMCPFITLLLCHFFLKDQRLNRSFLLAFIVCFLGFLIFNINAKWQFGFSCMLIFYILINGYSDYKLKQISNARGIEIMLFDNLMYLFVSSIVFVTAFFNEKLTKSLLGVGKFSFEKLITMNAILPLIAVTMLSFLAHNFKMLSYKAKHIAGIIIVGIFFKAVNSAIMTYIDDKTIPSSAQICGMVIMCMGLSVFAYRTWKLSNKLT